MTTFINPVSESSLLKGQKDFIGLSGSEERTESLRHVRKVMSCSEVLLIGVLASSNAASFGCFVFVVLFLYYQNIWDYLNVENYFSYWQLNNVANKTMVVTGYSHRLSHS